MDLVAQRYSSPFFIIETMMEQCRFFDFVIEINKIVNQETEDKKLWDIWLHRVYDQSYDSWIAKLKIKTNTVAPKQFDALATVQSSRNMLNGFSPIEQGR